MRSLILICFICVIKIFIHGQKVEIFNNYEGKFGLRDSFFNVIIEPQFDRIYSYSNEGVFIVGNQDPQIQGGPLSMTMSYGVINNKGVEILPVIYKDISIIQNVIIISNNINNERKYGLANIEGKIIIPIMHTDIRFTEKSKMGLIIEDDSTYFYIDSLGKEISEEFEFASDFIFDVALVVKNGKYGVINDNMKEILPIIFNEIDIIADNLIKVRKKNKYGLFDKSGKIIIPFILDDLKSISQNGLIPVKKKKWGYMNTAGKLVIPYKYDDANIFEGDLARVNMGGNEDFETEYCGFIGGGKWGFIDTLGEVIIPIKYDWAFNFNEEINLAQVQINNKWGVVNKDNKLIIPLIYDELEYFHEGKIRVSLNGKSGNIDTLGNVIEPLKYVNYSENSFFFVRVNDKFGLVDDSTQKELTKFKYDRYEYFVDGLSLVTENQKMGFINEKGIEVIPLIFDEATSFENGKAKVTMDNRTFYIDLQGKEVIQN
jgi:hypothetical protein